MAIGAGNERKVKCDGGCRDQAITAFRNRVETLGNVDDFGGQFRFVVLATGKRQPRPFFKCQRQRDAFPVAGFAELHQNDGGDINRTPPDVSVFELPSSVLSQSLTVAIDCPYERVGIGDGQRWYLRIHGLSVKRYQFPCRLRVIIASNVVEGIIARIRHSPATDQLEVRCGMRRAGLNIP